ncbi:MAG: hypothetical protein QT00_C0002G0381 [archaeon GW2011_AR5]|nr:MAG: hypothetical protein QT00_C0002G0381 [archaeon GW2011_AR5]
MQGIPSERDLPGCMEHYGSFLDDHGDWCALAYERPTRRLFRAYLVDGDIQYVCEQKAGSIKLVRNK